MSFFDHEKILTRIPAKDFDASEIVLAFPNTYQIGMASLGFQTVWKLLNENKDIKVRRLFTDIEERSKDKPEYIGFSFSWELDYKNIFEILERNNISLYSNQRSEEDPLVFAGGVVPNANPEPFVDNFDFFLIGDLEEIKDDFIQIITSSKNLKRKEKLEKLSEVEGIYVPGISVRVKKRGVTSHNLAFSSILTENCVWPNTFLVEVVRSCPELCRFCLASYGNLPFRTPDLKESLIPIINFGLKHTNKIGLLGASVTQHPEFEGLINYLVSARCSHLFDLSIQIASVRADTISNNLAEGLHKLGAKSITMAVETGSERLRDILNKKVNNETIFNSIQTIYNAGFNSIKLYGMVGLPFETKDDLKLTVDFLKEIKRKNKTKNLVWGCSVFVPKATTPFQFFGVDKNAEEKLKFLSKELHQIGVDFRPESYKWSLIQAFISRGDRSINKTLVKAYKFGSTLGSFNKAVKEEKINSDHFIFERWDEKSKLPWDKIQGFLNKNTVEKHLASTIHGNSLH